MKRISFLVALTAMTAALASCGGGFNGELVGVPDRPKWSQQEPYGTVFVNQGTFTIGQGDQDVFFNANQQAKTVSIKAFYMDDAEISNNEYRQFVYWVRDSLAHTILGNVIEDDYGKEYIDWKMKLDWSDPAVLDELEELYFPENEQVFGRFEVDVRKLNFVYKYFDLRAAADNRDPDRPRAEFIRTETVNVYPDTLVWARDFTFSYNEPQAQNYFSHPAYDDYPTVGVSWEQATAFCHWRTQLFNSYRISKGLSKQGDFRLPTEFEWEYAARGGHTSSPYPWGGPYIKNDKGCLIANFKPGRGNYTDDGGFYTVKTYSYNPNDYGIYNMAGNVSEWTSTAYDESAFSTVHDLNPDFKYEATEEDDIVMRRKVIRGGSWKDVGYLIQTGTRTFEYQDSTKSYVGFRCVMDFLGRDLRDF
jgi:formylglycine-generating enzyme